MSNPSDKRIYPSEVRYIKLGVGGKWVDRSLDSSEINYGFDDAPYELAENGDRGKLKSFYLSKNMQPANATKLTNEILDFYKLPCETLWITFARKHLWWCFASAEIVIPEDNHGGARIRRVPSGWKCKDILGQPLHLETLSSHLTKTAAFRATICKVEAQDYLLRRINAEQEPKVISAMAARADLLYIVEELIKMLHWRDFELLIDLLFARLGWQRVSEIGGTMADVDLVLEQPATKQRGLVQVKSTADSDSLLAFRAVVVASSVDYAWFVVHTSPGFLASGDLVEVWKLPEVAPRVLQTGLLDWLIERCR